MTGAITTNSTFDGRDVATDGTKLDGIEASADVTDTANVTAAGALMDSELTSEASVKALDQGVATTNSPAFTNLTLNGTGSVKVPAGTTAQRDGSPAAGMFRYNSSLAQFEGYTDAWGAIGGGGTNTFTTDSFTGDGSTAAYALSQSTASEDNLLVFIEGVFQQQDAYSIATSGGITTLTFSSAPANGNSILIYSVAAGVSGSNLNIDSMTGDGSDTTLTLSINPVNENNTQVFIDGVYQSKSNYSISGTTLTFSTAPPTGSAVEVMTMTQTDINVPVDGTITSAKLSGDLTLPGDLSFADNNKAIFGAGSDLEIYSDGDSSYLKENSATGSLFVDGDNIRFRTSDGSKSYALFTNSGSARLYHDNSIKIETTSTGIDVTGTVTATDLTLSDGTNPTLTITDTTNTTTLFLEAANLSTTIGTSTNHPLKFDTNNTERARIDESGNLLVGKTALDTNTTGLQLENDGYLSACRSGGNVFLINRKSSDGAIITLQKDGSTVGMIGCHALAGSSELFIGNNGNIGLGFEQTGSDRIFPCNGATGAERDAAIDLGSSSARFGNMYLSGNASMGSLSPGIVTIGSGSYFIGNSANGYRFNNAADTSNLMILKDDGTLLVGTTGAINSAKMSVNGNTTTFVIHPALDNNFDCGHPSYRWDDVRATNGTIQTSDRNEKQDIAELTDAEQRVAVAAKGLMRKFRWISSVQKKGDEARIHFGIIAQDLQAAFEAEGLDAGRYAMFISDTWTDEETGEERTRLGVRYSELLAFIISAI
jgi:hypothetical protein